MAGAATTRKSYPGKTSESWFPYLLCGYIQPSIGSGAVIASGLVPFDCIVRQVYLSVGLMDTNNCDDLDLKTVDVTALTVVAAQSPTAADIVNVLQTLDSDIDGVEIVAGNGFQCTGDAAASEGSSVQWLLMLEAIR